MFSFLYLLKLNHSFVIAYKADWLVGYNERVAAELHDYAIR